MHGGHAHDHLHDHSNGGGGALAAAPAGIGHNRPVEPQRPVQWQTPHRDDAPAAARGGSVPRPISTWSRPPSSRAFSPPATRPASCGWRGCRSKATAADGAKLALLRVEVDSVADVGSITPHLGGASFRYDPLPARMVSRRKRLRLVYFDGQKPRMLDLAEALSLVTAW